MTDPRRRFSAAERTALYLAADGRCTDCGVELDRGWHSDHIDPHSRGGITDVINGQALCPPCNLKKGNRVPIEPRHWQNLFLAKYTAHAPENFLLVACPGAGKTLAAGFVARDLLNDDVIDRVLVVAPSAALREQWRKALALLDIYVDEGTMNNEHGEMSTIDGRSTQGWVVTYQSLSAAPLIHRHLNGRRRTLVILDEVHHLSAEGGQWGAAAVQALGPCVRRLSLSGTPFRGDHTAIPFVEYENTTDGGHQCRYRDDPDGTPYPYGFDYSYGVALTDNPPPVRPVVFEHYDGDVEWMNWDDSKPTRVRMSDDITDKKIRSRANRHVLNPAGEWLTTVLRDADRRLEMVRAEGDHTAKGLIVCYDTDHADAVAAHLSQVTTGKVYTAVSVDQDGREASEKARSVIENFGAGSGRWLVAVQMVTEGVDIPQLRVGVYATTVRTPLFFRQLVGRVVRRRADLPDEVDQTSYLFVPKEPKMLALADAVQDEVTFALTTSTEDEEDEPAARQDALDFGDGAMPLPLDPFRESTADESGVLVPGRGHLQSDIVRLVAEQTGQPYGVAAAVLAAGVAAGLKVEPVGSPVAEQADRPRDRIKRRRILLEKLIRQYTALLLKTSRAGDDFGRVISVVKSELYEDAGIYRRGMSPAEKKHALARADLPVIDTAVAHVTKLLGSS